MAEPFRVEETLDLLLVLLFAPGSNGEEHEPIEGITRLQKLVFLLNRGKGPASLVEIAKKYEYEAYKMGPYTDTLRDDLDTLISLGLVGTERLRYLISDDVDDPYDPYDSQEKKRKRIESQKFSLTDNGIEAGSELWDSLSSTDKDALEKFKGFFCSLSLRQLLIFVYDQFPKFTVKSEIKRQLGM